MQTCVKLTQTCVTLTQKNAVRGAIARGNEAMKAQPRQNPTRYQWMSGTESSVAAIASYNRTYLG